jgi:hypothetical protein
VIAVGALAGACGLSLSGTDDNNGGTADAGGDTPTAGEAGGVDASDAGGGRDATGEVAALDSGCPHANFISDMVSVGPFCIDETEVTQSEYLTFLASDAGPQPTTSCPLGTSYESLEGRLATNDNPAVVNWCGAWAYCKWAGKRLCGNIAGGPLNGPDVDMPAKSQWAFACTNNGAHKYPYGSQFDASACPGGTTYHAELPPVGTCQGGFPGIFDMSGNVWEWIDSCSGPMFDADCMIRGGQYNSNDAQLACAPGPHAKRNQLPNLMTATGFRCCAP